MFVRILFVFLFLFREKKRSDSERRKKRGKVQNERTKRKVNVARPRQRLRSQIRAMTVTTTLRAEPTRRVKTTLLLTKKEDEKRRAPIRRGRNKKVPKRRKNLKSMTLASGTLRNLLRQREIRTSRRFWKNFQPKVTNHHHLRKRRKDILEEQIGMLIKKSPLSMPLMTNVS